MNVLSCFLNNPVSRVDLMSTGSLLHAFGAATLKHAYKHALANIAHRSRFTFRPTVSTDRGSRVMDNTLGSSRTEDRFLMTLANLSTCICKAVEVVKYD